MVCWVAGPALRRCRRRGPAGSPLGPSYQQQLAWAPEERSALQNGEGYSVPLRAVPRLIDLLHAASPGLSALNVF